jgi:hypothetical protein
MCAVVPKFICIRQGADSYRIQNQQRNCHVPLYALCKITRS